MTRTEIQEFLSSKPFVLLDGAMGTELERLGYRTTLPLWSAMANVEAPTLVKQIHDNYIRAGADIITTNTFRTTAHTFSKVNNASLAPHVTRLAIELAQEAIMQSGRKVLLAGSLAPLEDCYRPDLVPDEHIISGAYTDQIELLIGTGVDFVLAETMINRKEIEFISRYMAERDFPFMMSFVVENARLLDGTPMESVIPDGRQASPDVTPSNPLALLLNCRSSIEITKNLPFLQNLFNGMIGAYGNGPGHPDDELGWCLAEGGLEEYKDAVKVWIDQGVRIIGGCCGTTPEYITAINKLRRVYTVK